jgi:hypothetical protein
MIYSAKDDNFSYVSKYKCLEDSIKAKRIKTKFKWTKLLILEQWMMAQMV